MKSGIHPEYRLVVFRDVSCDFQFLTRSCAAARDKTEIDGVEYPMIAIDVSSESHPFYTGTQKLMDTEGRVERFRRKYGFSTGEGEAAE
jgi:large subunit ribosomal protein L31